MKNIKAWAIVSKEGAVLVDIGTGNDCIWISTSQQKKKAVAAAKTHRKLTHQRIRVVPCVITFPKK